MKKIFLILLIFLTAGALIFYYFIREKDGLFDPWKLVPSQSAFVIESNYPLNSWKEFLDSKVGEGYKKTQLYSNTIDFFNDLDSLSATPGASEKLLTASMLISGIPTAQDQMDLLYILPADGTEVQTILQRTLHNIENDQNIEQSSRVYEEQTIHEVSDGNSRSLAFTFYQNYLIISKSAFLVEMVVRQIKNEYRNNFKAQNDELFDLPLLTNDAGNIYINFSRLSRGLKTFAGLEQRSFFDALENKNGGAAFDLTFSNEALVINGFSISYDSTTFLDEPAGIKPGNLNVVNYIPGNTQYVWASKISPEELPSQSKDIEKWIGEEVTYVRLPSLRENQTSEMLFIDTRDPGEALNYFNIQAEKAAKEDTIYREYYAGYPLTESAPQVWPETYLPNIYSTFDQSFFTVISNYIVLSNNLEALKVALEDVENENTWGKNMDLRKYFSLALSESNFSLIIHPDNFWNQLISLLNEPWRKKFQNNEQFLKGFILSIIQLSRIEDKFYISAVMAYEPREVLSEGVRNMTTRFITEFGHSLSVRPFVVKNHNNNQFEIVVQDDQKQLSLLDWKGNVLWTDSVAEQINKDITQIDFYNNEKLQYFFTGNNKLFIIDRNGENVEDYPISIGPLPIKFASVVDYDNSKNYRFLISDIQGSLYMVDKHGNVLDGWTPKKLEGALSAAPFHVRVRARDYIIAIQERGDIHVMNRRGESYPGFPIELKSRIGGDIFLQKGTDADGTVLNIVTTSGQLVKINLSGKVLSKENLYRPTRESKFYIVPEVQNKGYLIVRQGLNRLAILDEKGERMFEKDYLSTKPMDVHYYNFGAGKEIVTITDEEQQFTYLYNEEGNLINSQPINSGEPVAILYFNSTKQFHVFKVFENQLEALTF